MIYEKPSPLLLGAFRPIATAICIANFKAICPNIIFDGLTETGGVLRDVLAI